jgi:signal transduction histidine kinase
VPDTGWAAEEVRLTSRRRVVIGCLAMAVLGYSVIHLYHGIETRLGCTSTLIRAAHACSLGARHISLARMILAALLLIALVAVAVAVAVWCLRPLQEMATMVERLGPQNLAERSPVGPKRDETGRLALALNDMMDRLASGYDAQRSFAANASHELRTPLAVQRTLIEVSMAGARSPDQIALLTDQLLATNERNERLIEGLLVLSESDRGLVSRTPQRLDEIAGFVVDSHREMAAKASVVMRPELSETIVLGERVLLERLVINLVRNAIAYNVNGGEVLIAVGHSPTLVVENTGSQIPAESVGGLFEPFRRGTADRTHHGGGAGLGLTIVRSICQAHDGAVDARPGSQGGLRIEVRLPTA